MDCIQLAVSPKGLDATTITAADTIRRLLGFGDRLASLHRQRWIEIQLGPVRGASTPTLDEELDAYVGKSFELWNANKERCWLRLAGEGGTIVSAEFVPNAGRRLAHWGSPPLDVSGMDHLLVWDAPESDGLGNFGPSDLPYTFGGRRIESTFSGELYSFAWGEPADEKTRRTWIDKLAVVKNRSQGLLVQPHYQEHEVYCGALPTGLGTPQKNLCNRTEDIRG